MLHFQTALLFLTALATAAPNPAAIQKAELDALVVKYNANNDVDLGQYSFLVTASSDYSKLMSYYQTVDIMTPTQLQSWLSDYYDIATDPSKAYNTALLTSLLTAFPTKEYATLMGELFPTSIVGSYDVNAIISSAYAGGYDDEDSPTTSATATATSPRATSSSSNTSAPTTTSTTSVQTQETTSAQSTVSSSSNDAMVNGGALSVVALALTSLFSVALII